MKKLLLVPCLLAVFSMSPGIAAPSFTGGYVGGLLGHNNGKVSGNTQATQKYLETMGHQKMNSTIYGFNVGYAHQTADNLYLGVDFSSLFGAKGKKKSYRTNPAGPLKSSFLSEKVALSLMGRVGIVLMKDIAPFLEAGYQCAKYSLETQKPTGTSTISETKGALAYGLGVNFKAGPALLSVSYRTANTKLHNTKIRQNRILFGAAYQF